MLHVLGKRRDAYWVLVDKSQGKKPLEIPKHKGPIILKLIFNKWGGGGMERIDLAQPGDGWRDLVNIVMNLRVP